MCRSRSRDRFVCCDVNAVTKNSPVMWNVTTKKYPKQNKVFFASAFFSSRLPSTEVKMNNYCRLCADLKTYDELNIQISDATLKIHEKLTACCQWDKYQPNASYPSAICYLCYEKLEKSWLFSESIAFAQRKLQEVLHEIELAPVKFDSDVNYDDGGFNAGEFDAYAPGKMEIFVEPILPSPKTKKEKTVTTKISVETMAPSNAPVYEQEPIASSSSSSCDPVDGTQFHEYVKIITGDESEVGGQILQLQSLYVGFHLIEFLFQANKRTHSNAGSSHVCSNCAKEFATASNLRRHLRNVHGEYVKPKENGPEYKYECYNCHRKFRLKWTLQKHLSVHSDDRPYECWLCHKA